MSKRRTILFLVAFLALVIITLQTGLAADDRVFYGLIALFVLTQVAWLAYYLRLQRQAQFTKDIEQLFSDD